MSLIILDRDGVINQDSAAYIKTPSEWLPIPGSLEAIGRLSQAGWQVVVATNQSGLGRGLFDTQALTAIHKQMHTAVASQGGKIDAIFFCPHQPEDNCSCRKPAPGMFYDIQNRYEVSLQGVPIVGDSLRDLQAGVAAGCDPWLVLTGKGKTTVKSQSHLLPDNTKIHSDLAAVVDNLLKI